MNRKAVDKTPGAILKKQRESIGLSLGQAAAMTRIPRTMLAHLESDRYDEYTADVFVRGHLKSYARELELDPESVVQAYNRHTGRRQRGGQAEDDPDGAESAAARRVRTPGVGAQLSRVTRHVRASHIVAVGLFLVFLFFVVNVVSGSRATAKDPAKFDSEEQWEVEQAAEETRWALEQPAEKDADEDAED